ncbi:MAG TPA: flagellar motor protein MotB [Ignavibacteriales bacterium]|nr:flagellar motor protein MotB [Ignavibacteriales bacterium]
MPSEFDSFFHDSEKYRSQTPRDYRSYVQKKEDAPGPLGRETNLNGGGSSQKSETPEKKKESRESLFGPQVQKDPPKKSLGGAKAVSQKKPPEEISEDWMVTYSDTITLLLTFFVMLFALSTLDQKKYEALKEGIDQQLLKKQEDSHIDILVKELDLIIKKYNLQKDMTVTPAKNGVKLEFSSHSFYESGSAKIKDEMLPVLSNIADMLKSFSFKDYLVEVEGHTDDVPINTPFYPSNWELSVGRATNVVRYFQDLGIDPYRMKAAGYADSRPKVPNKDENGIPIPQNREANRRVTVFIERLEN